MLESFPIFFPTVQNRNSNLPFLMSLPCGDAFDDVIFDFNSLEDGHYGKHTHLKNYNRILS